MRFNILHLIRNDSLILAKVMVVSSWGLLTWAAAYWTKSRGFESTVVGALASAMVAKLPSFIVTFLSQKCPF